MRKNYTEKYEKMSKTILLNRDWNLHFEGKSIPAVVPGDITLDLYNAGIIENPYYGMNHKKLHWIIGRDFEYRLCFDLPDEIMDSEEIVLEFDGIDTFADIYLNGKKIGSCEDMFLQYVFSVKNLVKKVRNELSVRMRSTTKIMDGIDDAGYFGVFNTKRLFIRKAQCHFGWDWAPDMPGYGIYKEVRIKGVYKNRLDTVHYRVYNDGNVMLFADLNYTIRPQMDFEGKLIKCSNEECREDILRYTLALEADKPLGESKRKTLESRIEGKKNFKNFCIDDPRLWYPAGEGAQPLYAYKVELIRDGKIIDERRGRLAFREIELLQKPVGENVTGYKFVINGQEVFIKGANWVPAECFVGAIDIKKYDDLIAKAAEANFNMLRVWGGGIYENDRFYDLCDEKGIMVWQDMMFACADIPEDNPEFISLVSREIEYQIKRLRVHPCIVYWCGGNEKTGSYGLQICRGDNFVDVILRGLVTCFDDTRPYARQSPCSLTDVGNDRSSGESHAGSFETCLTTGPENYRKAVSENLVPFVSECAIMGAGPLESLKKIFPEDKLWDMNEYWDDRLMDNPYSAVRMSFPLRQRFYAERLYGKCKNIRDFICKSMTVHAETMRAEIEFARYNRERCGGFMNWMYSDIWPSATWSVVDYYGEPKQVYYQMKKSYAPVLLTFLEDKGKTFLVLINDGKTVVDSEITYGLKTLSGKVLRSEKAKFKVLPNRVEKRAVDWDLRLRDTYLFAGDGKHSAVYSFDMWHSCTFQSRYSYAVRREESGISVTVKAKEFAKGVTLRLPENYKYEYSDNYFDLQAGEEKTVRIRGDADERNLVVTDFAKETADV